MLHPTYYVKTKSSKAYDLHCSKHGPHHNERLAKSEANCKKMFEIVLSIFAKDLSRFFKSQTSSVKMFISKPYFILDWRMLDNKWLRVNQFTFDYDLIPVFRDQQQAA